MSAVRQRRRDNLSKWMARAERRIKLAKEKGQIRCEGDPATAALAMFAMIDGLIRNWMFDPERFDLMKMGQCLIDPYVDGLRLRS